MRILRLITLALMAVMPLTSCMLTSGQIIFSLDLEPNPYNASNPGVEPLPVDLTTDDTYNDHKDEIQDVADIALLGEVTNTGPGTASVDFYMTRELTTYTTAVQVLADPTVVKVWGPLTLGPNETKRIDWDESAGLFVGRQAVLDEAKGDGKATFYGIATTGATARVDDPVLVIVIDAAK